MKIKTSAVAGALAVVMSWGMGGTSASAGEELSLEGLMSAPYPSMCGLEPGTLQDGKWVGKHDGNVQANAPGVTSWYNPDAAPQLVDLDGDGTDEMVVEFDCDQGGVSWPTEIVVYTKGWKVAGVIRLGDQPEYPETASKARVDRWTIDGNTLSVDWKVGQSPSPTDPWTGVLTMAGGKPDLVGVRPG